MKYLYKKLVKESEQHNEAIESMSRIDGYEAFSALLWLTGKRHYSMSQGLRSAVSDGYERQHDDERDCELLGTARGLDSGFILVRLV